MNPCRVCSHPLFEEPLLRYQNMPSIAQNFPDASELKHDGGVDLVVCQCSGCGLVQLNTDPVPYFRDVIRSIAFSPGMGNFRKIQFTEIIQKYGLKGKKFLEVGCGRGEYLSLLQECGGNAFGLEHLASSVEDGKRKNLQVTQGFIESSQQKISHAPFDAFFIFNFLEHIPDPKSFLRGIGNNLVESGVGLVEVPNFDMILKERMASEFMRDHLFYFTEDTLRSTLQWNGFEVLECNGVWHSYILSAVVRKRPKLDLESFDKHQKKIQSDIDNYLQKFPELSMAVWGAGHQALAVLSLSGLQGRIKYVVDSAPFKQNRYTPATHIPIVSPEVLLQDNDLRGIIVMGASYSDEIVETLQEKYRKNLSLSVLRAEGLEVVRL